MKKHYLYLLLTLLYINLRAQSFDWAKLEGHYAYDYGYGIITDNAGNVYAAGKYEENAVFSGVTLPNQGNHDIWVAKYSSSGSLIWIRTGGGGLGDYAHAIACDGSNYIYVAGEIEGTDSLIVFPGSSITLTCHSENDAFLAKYDLNGNLIWARGAGWYQNDKGLGVANDHAGNIYMTGFFTDTAAFGSTMIYSNPANFNSEDFFLTKYDANGNVLWVRQAGGPGRDEPKSVKCDAAGNVYVTGMYGNGCVFGSQTLSAPGNYVHIFLAKYDTNGNLLWVKTAGSDYDDVGWDIAIDNSGRVYVTGEFNAYNYQYNLTTAGMADVFVACYDSNGNIIWTRRAGGTEIDRARGIGTDGTNIYITGQFGATASFGSHSVTAADSSDVFIAALNNNGDFLSAVSIGGPVDAPETLGYESGIAICANADGAYATGALLNGGICGSISLTAWDRTDVFITKVSNLVGIEEIAAANNGIAIYPNPNMGQFTVFNSDHSAGLSVYNAIGQKVFDKILSSRKEDIDIRSMSAGIYFVELRKEDDKIYRQKIVIE